MNLKKSPPDLSSDIPKPKNKNHIYHGSNEYEKIFRDQVLLACIHRCPNYNSTAREKALDIISLADAIMDLRSL